MLLHKCVNQRHDIVISDAHCSVILEQGILDLPLLRHNQLLRKAIVLHIVVVAAVILRQYKGFLSRRQQNLLFRDRSVVRHLTHIVEADHHIPLVIHLLDDSVKLGDGCHDLIVPGCGCIRIKCLCIVDNQRVKEYMCDLVDRIWLAAALRLLIGVGKRLELVVLPEVLLRLEQIDRTVIIILRGKQIRLRLHTFKIRIAAGAALLLRRSSLLFLQCLRIRIRIGLHLSGFIDEKSGQKRQDHNQQGNHAPEQHVAPSPPVCSLRQS